jgi:hypothetical protein
MQKRCCENCTYARRPTSHWLRIILSRWAGLLLCFNCTECPGQMTEVVAHGVCRNFRRKIQQGRRRRPPKPRDNKVRYIPLTRDLIAVVDAEDFEELNQYKWYALKGLNTFYAARREGRETILMHRVIMKPPKGMVVDHIDGNGLNNRRSNLRICTVAQNGLNSRARGGRSGYKGVEYAEQNRKNKYRAVVHDKGKRIPGGSYATALEAAVARDRLARAVQGEYAYLNVPGAARPQKSPPRKRPGKKAPRKKPGAR